ncbi:MAG: peptidase [Burkholderiales bacterium]|jgi:cell wall-associated NlpC family hydrolase|nr:peptidase [Burkholderiales bacterium]
MKALLLSSMLAVLVAGCSSAPQRAPSASTGSTRPTAELGDQAASHAMKMVGKPYRYGGASPAGFDCSGLILYSYRQAGVSVPRSTESQRAAARPIKVSQVRRGDLLYFNQEGKKYGHAAIYLGDNRFVHAPSSGKAVRVDRLDSPYWKKHLSEARRL